MSDVHKIATDAAAGIKAEAAQSVNQAEALAAQGQAVAQGWLRRNVWGVAAVATMAVLLLAWVAL